MNPELLRKCLSGKADASEWMAYQLWLEGDPDQEESGLSVPAEPGDEQRIWNRIAVQNHQSDRSRRHKRRYFLSAAASIALVCSFVVLGIKYSGPAIGIQIFKSAENNPFHEKEFEGLRFKLGKDSEVKMQDVDGQTDVQFAGNIMLSNRSGRDRETEIFYKQTNGKQTSKKLKLKKDRTYYLASNPVNDQLLIVEDRAFMDMPPVLARNLKSEFNQF